MTSTILGPFGAKSSFFYYRCFTFFKTKWILYYWSYSMIWNVNVTVIWNVLSNQKTNKRKKNYNGFGSSKPKHIFCMFIVYCFCSQMCTDAGRFVWRWFEASRGFTHRLMAAGQSVDVHVDCQMSAVCVCDPKCLSQKPRSKWCCTHSQLCSEIIGAAWFLF